jgi:hypothetical protein
MISHRVTRRPEKFATLVARLKHRWMVPFGAFEWLSEWVAYGLSRWSFLEVLEYLGSFSVLIGVIFYFSESGDRIKQRHYQAWQVINTAQGMSHILLQQQPRYAVLHLHHLSDQQSAVAQRSAPVPDLGRSHVALGQEVTAKTIGDLGRIDAEF